MECVLLDYLRDNGFPESALENGILAWKSAANLVIFIPQSGYSTRSEGVLHEFAAEGFKTPLMA